MTGRRLNGVAYWNQMSHALSTLESVPAKPRSASAEGLPEASEKLLFQKLFKLPPLERIKLIKRGISAKWFLKVSERMGMSKRSLYKTIGVAKATVTHKARQNSRLDENASEKVLAMMMLLGQVESMIEESGTAEGFDASAWMADWLDSPQPALGGNRPGDLMDTADGRALVSDLLARMQSGAYA
jgi:putative toxin-antitoxin system antitoxin component (TIGR02293 family)